jgi:hypothetical protein
VPSTPPHIVTNAVVSSVVGWGITCAVFFAVDVVARKHLATRWLRSLILAGFLLSTAFWVLVAALSARSPERLTQTRPEGGDVHGTSAPVRGRLAA